MRVAFLLALICTLPGAATAANCPAPKSLRFDVSSEVHRSMPGFTEGLEFHDGALYESTGDVFGTSRVDRIDPATGKVSVLVDAGRSYFGEGLTIFDGKLYQMTWKEHRVFQFDLKGNKLREFSNPREGWGLTHDAKRLIASDGSDHLFFLSPEDFHTIGTVQVREGDTPIFYLNELEYVGGEIYANIFETRQIVVISPRTGCVKYAADMTPLWDHFTEAEKAHLASDDNYVLNGIAHDPATGLFTLTGKYWPALFTGRFVGKAP